MLRRCLSCGIVVLPFVPSAETSAVPTKPSDVSVKREASAFDTSDEWFRRKAQEIWKQHARSPDQQTCVVDGRFFTLSSSRLKWRHGSDGSFFEYQNRFKALGLADYHFTGLIFYKEKVFPSVDK